MNSLNQPISPTLINKCIGAALVPVAGYAVWMSAKNLVGFDFSDFMSELFFIGLPLVCMLGVAVFCVLFALKAFRSEYIKKLAIVMAFVQVACIAFLAALDAWIGKGGATGNGDADFAFAVIYLWVFFMLYLPTVVIAAVCATVGITSLLKPRKEESKNQ